MQSKPNHFLKKGDNIKILEKKEIGLNLRLPEASEVKKCFPVLPDQYLRDVTFGIFQLKEAVNFVNEHLSVQGRYDISLNQNELFNLVHVKIQFRHMSSKIQLLN